MKFLMALVIIGVTSIIGTPLKARDLDKPVLNTPIDPENWQFSHTLLQQLQSTSGTITQTNFTIKICWDCQNKFEEEGYDYRNGMELFNVTYADCGEPWIMCRHSHASISQHAIMKFVAVIPLNLRKYIRHVITLPDRDDTDSFEPLDGTVEYDEGNLILRGRVSFMTLLAGAAHALAEHGFSNSPPTPYWESKAWLDAYTADTALLNNAAKTSQEENFKQMAVMAVYDSQCPGFMNGNLVPEWQKFEHMLRRIQSDASPGSLNKTEESTCDGRIPSDRPGTME